jgi:hypothetical protein
MSDVRKWLDRKVMYACDLEGKDWTLEIERVEQGEISTEGGKKGMPMCHFKGAKKPLGLNSTNTNTIGQLLGTFEASRWPGNRVTLYVTTTKTKAGIVDCIRVRNVKP